MYGFFLFFYTIALFAHEQIILVVAEDMNRSDAKLYTLEKRNDRFIEVFAPFDVNLGRNGLGWGIGIESLDEYPKKREGDGRAPAGVFALPSAFGYERNITTKLPYMQATNDLLCIDDTTSESYNKIVRATDKKRYKSFEQMLREDDLYSYGIVVAHNQEGIKGRGSCIFLHVQKSQNAPTAGCTSMPKERLSQLLRWLDPKKEPILIQIPASHIAVAKRYGVK